MDNKTRMPNKCDDIIADLRFLINVSRSCSNVNSCRRQIDDIQFIAEQLKYCRCIEQRYID